VSKTDRPSDLLAALVEADVHFIVVGGMAAVLHGAPITTHDLDIVHDRTPKNVGRLLEALLSINAGQRGDPRHLSPTAAALAGSGHLTLMTDLGPLDVLCELGPGEGYDELLGRTVRFSDGGVEFRVLSLEALIEIKRRTDRAKDRLMLAELVATLETRKRGAG
jgi:hypothetical protein